MALAATKLETPRDPRDRLRALGFSEVFLFASKVSVCLEIADEIAKNPDTWRTCAWCKKRFADLSKLPSKADRQLYQICGFCSRECASNHLDTIDVDIALDAHLKNSSPGFYQTREWREMRYGALLGADGKCQCCGASADDAELHVDHIKPRWFYPHLALDPNNLQVLCKDCNLGKGAWDDTDWRNNDG